MRDWRGPITPPVIPSIGEEMLLQRERVRGALAIALLALIALVLTGTLVLVGSGRLDPTAITQAVFPSLIALAGTALGFYFGSQARTGAPE